MCAVRFASLEQFPIACAAVNFAMVAGALVDRFLTLTAWCLRGQMMSLPAVHTTDLVRNQVVPTLTVVASIASPAYS